MEIETFLYDRIYLFNLLSDIGLSCLSFALVHHSGGGLRWCPTKARRTTSNVGCCGRIRMPDRGYRSRLLRRDCLNVASMACDVLSWCDQTTEG